jgi:hypothetical protein
MATVLGARLIRLARPSRLNAGVIAAVLLTSLTTGFMGGLIVWALWRYDLLNPREHGQHP